MVVLGCTEPNPFAKDTDGSSESSSSAGSTAPTSTSADPTTATTPSTTTTDATTDTPTGTTSVDPTESTGPDLDTSTSTGEPTCAHNCVALPPMGWSGPVAVLHDAPDDPAATCEGAFDELATIAFASLDAPAATCDCDCDDPEGAACSQVTLENFDNDDVGCAANPPLDSWTFGLSCSNAPGGAAGSRWRATAEINAGSCDPVETFVVADATWGDRYTSCGVENYETAGCQIGLVCVPTPVAPYDGRLCVTYDGEQECPQGYGYDERSVYYRDYADDRACESCSCGDVEGECGGSLVLWNPASCSGTPLATLTIGGACVQTLTQGVESGDVMAAGLTPNASADCDPSDSQATGEAEGIDPVTFCCDS